MPCLFERVGLCGAPLQGSLSIRIAVSTVTDVRTYILILYNYKWILQICGSGIAFLQGVEEGSLGLNVTTCLLNINCYSLLFYMLQDARSCVKMLVFDRLDIPLLFRHSAVQSTYDTLIPFDTNAYICSVAPCLQVLWMSTHGCFDPSFPPFYT